MASTSKDHRGKTGSLLLLALTTTDDHTDSGRKSQKTSAGGKVHSAAWKHAPTAGRGEFQLAEEFQKSSPCPHSHSPRRTVELAAEAASAPSSLMVVIGLGLRGPVAPAKAATLFRGDKTAGGNKGSGEQGKVGGTGGGRGKHAR